MKGLWNSFCSGEIRWENMEKLFYFYRRILSISDILYGFQKNIALRKTYSKDYKKADEMEFCTGFFHQVHSGMKFGFSRNGYVFFSGF